VAAEEVNLALELLELGVRVVEEMGLMKKELQKTEL
jgi:hypothetical protein